MQQPEQFAIWQAQFAAERVRLLQALGEIASGGVVEQVQHIGATSVPGLWASPCVDVSLSVWPFPLQTRQQEALRELGYELLAGEEEASEQRFVQATGVFQLFVAEAGSDRWTNYLLLRDYLRDTDSARQSFSAQKQAYSSVSSTYAQWKAQILPQLVEAAQAWWVDRQSFEAVESVATELKDYRGLWAVSSGWALDLYLGRVTRVHHDVDVVVGYADQLALRLHLSDRGWKLVTPYEGRLEPWPLHMTLELPRNQVHALRGAEFIDFQLTPIEGRTWHYRRAPIVVRHLDQTVLYAASGIPFLAPEIVLLFKSKNTSFNQKERGQDPIDFVAVQPHLEAERRAWLRWALLATDPAHRWIEQLG